MADSLLDTVTIPEPVLKVWRETEWEIDGWGHIRTPKTCRCPLIEACAVIVGRVWSNGSLASAAHDLGISDNHARLIVHNSDYRSAGFRTEFEQLLGLRV